MWPLTAYRENSRDYSRWPQQLRGQVLHLLMVASTYRSHSLICQMEGVIVTAPHIAGVSSGGLD